MHHNYWAHTPQLESLRAATIKPMRSGARAPQLERSLCTTTRETRAPQWGTRARQRKIPHATTKIPHAAAKTQHSQINK